MSVLYYNEDIFISHKIEFNTFRKKIVSLSSKSRSLAVTGMRSAILPQSLKVISLSAIVRMKNIYQNHEIKPKFASYDEARRLGWSPLLAVFLQHNFYV
jgi:hypothetical protein